MSQREKVRVAIVYATRGGMGGVGKFAAMQALSDPRVTPTIIAVSDEQKEGSGLGITTSELEDSTTGYDTGTDPEVRDALVKQFRVTVCAANAALW